MADVVALSVMEGLRLSGLRAPEDVSVTGGKKVDVELVERESVMALE